jgi:hypothetical protein
MVLAGGEDLDKINRLAFDLFKAVEAPPAVTADCFPDHPFFRSVSSVLIRGRVLFF